MNKIDIGLIATNAGTVYTGEKFIRAKKDPGQRALVSGASLFGADLIAAYAGDITSKISETTGNYTKDVIAAGLATFYVAMKKKGVSSKLIMDFLVSLGYNISANYLYDMVKDS